MLKWEKSKLPGLNVQHAKTEDFQYTIEISKVGSVTLHQIAKYGYGRQGVSKYFKSEKEAKDAAEKLDKEANESVAVTQNYINGIRGILTEMRQPQTLTERAVDRNQVEPLVDKILEIGSKLNALSMKLNKTNDEDTVRTFVSDMDAQIIELKKLVNYYK